MAWQLTESADEFLAAAGDFLLAERGRNTVVLTVAETVRQRPATYRAGPLFGWWQPAGEPVSGVAMQTPPFPALLTAMPDRAASSLAGELAGRALPGVTASAEVAAVFAAAWRSVTGARSREYRRMRLFRLGTLSWPSPLASGSERTARPADSDQVVRWFEAFADEVGELADQDHQASAADRLSYGGITFWEDGGRPVSLAGVTRQVAGTIRVGPVYTPPELRGHGYAGAVTAAVSQAALDAGVAEVLLFTDLANPTSNALYQRLGYRPVEDRVMLEFGPDVSGTVHG